MSRYLAPDHRAPPAWRPPGWQRGMLQNSIPSAGHPRQPLGATHPTPGRPLCVPFTQLVPQRQSPGRGADSRRLSRGALDSPHPARRERSHSLTRLAVPTTGPHTNGPRDPRPSPLGVTFRSPLVTPRARSGSVSVPATPRRGGATQKPKPPWK